MILLESKNANKKEQEQSYMSRKTKNKKDSGRTENFIIKQNNDQKKNKNENRYEQ